MLWSLSINFGFDKKRPESADEIIGAAHTAAGQKALSLSPSAHIAVRELIKLLSLGGGKEVQEVGERESA